MKNLAALILASSFSLVTLAAAAADLPAPMAAALAAAKARHAPVFVDFHAPWCYSCYYMAKNVLTGPEWEKVARSSVVVEFDADAPEGAELMKRWNVKALPTYVVLAETGEELGRILGEQTRKEFYGKLGQITRNAATLPALQARAAAGSLPATRQVLRAYLARYDADAGLSWFYDLPGRERANLTKDTYVASLLARLDLQRAAAVNDVPACISAGKAVLSTELGCERPYELDKVLACSEKLPPAERTSLLQTQRPPLDQLLGKHVFGSGERCADERSSVLTAADLYKALGDAAAEKSVLDRAIASTRDRLGDDLVTDRNLADNLRVFLDRAGRVDELDALFPRLIAAYPDDYVYAYRHAKSLAARGKHDAALKFYEQAAEKAYGVNRLRVADLHARSLRAAGRQTDALRALADALKANGPWFPEEAAKLKSLLAEIQGG